MPTITISGERQSGRTDMLLAIAMRDAWLGRRVLYETDSDTSLKEAFRRFCDDLPRVHVKTVYAGNGDEHVVFQSNGRVYFQNCRRHGGCPTVDTIILDFDFDETIPATLDFTAASSRIQVYRTETVDA